MSKNEIDLESLRDLLWEIDNQVVTHGIGYREVITRTERVVSEVIAELAARRARDAEAVRRQDMTTNDKLADALRNLIRAGKHLRNTVVETRGVAGMDDHDVAISDSIAALAEHDAQPAPEL